MSEARRDTERASLITSGRPGGGGHPTGWMVVPLGEVIREPLRNGHSSKASSDGTGVRTLTLTAVTIGDFSEKNTKMTVADPAKVRGLWLEPGDILVERANTPELVGTARLYRGLNHYAIFPDLLIRVRLADGVLPSFVEHALSTESARSVFRQAAQGIAGSMPKIDQETVERFPLCLAPTAEQHRIVDEVEKQFTRLDAAVAGLQRVKANLKRYRASVLKAACEGRLVPTEAELARREGRPFESGEELLKRILKERRARWEADHLARFAAAGKTPSDDAWKRKYEEPEHEAESPETSLPKGWCSATLAQLSWSSGYGTSTKCAYAASGPPVLRIPNVEKACLDLDDLKCAIDPSAVAGDDPLAPGDFLVVRTNGSRALIGRGALVREAFRDPHHFASYLIRFRLAARAFTAGWLSIVWQSPRVRTELEGKAATSAGQYNLSLTSLLPTRVPIPPLPEQHRIVAEVERRLSVVDELEATVEKNLARCARLRQSILKMAFEGRLVPQDPTDEPAGVLLERIRRERNSADVADARPPRRKAAKL